MLVLLMGLSLGLTSSDQYEKLKAAAKQASLAVSESPSHPFEDVTEEMEPPQVSGG